MTLRQRILTVVVVLVLLVATPSIGLEVGGAPIATSSVTILPGPLVATLTWVSGEEQPRGTNQGSEDGYLMLTVLDERGHASGWSVSVSTVSSSGAGRPFGADQVVLVPDAVSMARGNPSLVGHSTFSVDPVSTSPTLLWSVSERSGDGEYTLPLGGTLGIPATRHRNTLFTLIVSIDGVAP